MRIAPYSWLLVAGIIIGAIYWSRIARRDSRLVTIYFFALVGAFIGAKIVYFAAEGYQYIDAPDFWLQLATGKSILGGLLGGYITVEITKRVINYPGITGDWFALIAPVGILLGRIGCLVHGCCRGVTCHPAWYTIRDSDGIARWPSVPVEILFNAAAIMTFFILRKRRMLQGQHFHLYLISYGAFRFAHEFLRDEPRFLGPITGYQLAALILFIFGMFAFVHRENSRRKIFQPAS